MRIAIMQPYLFPYIGYYQLIHAVDKFVIYDDVNYINRGWINRNRILIQNGAAFITLPLAKASQNKKICELGISDAAPWQEKMLRTIELAYKKAPFFDEIFPVCKRIIWYDSKQLSKFLLHSIETICKLLMIQTVLIVSSSVYNNQELSRELRLIDIAKKENCNKYINAIGGIELYEARSFQNAGISICFLEPAAITYPQFSSEFVSNLSIIDVLMFNGPKRTAGFLNAFKLVNG